VQVGPGFQQVNGEAVAEHVGINLLLNTGAMRSVLTGVAGGLGIDGLIAAVPAVAGKQPGAGLFAQTSPERAEFVEQDRTEHHIPVLATPPCT